MIKRDDLPVEQRNLDAAVLAGNQLGVRVHPLMFGCVECLRLGDHGLEFSVPVKKFDARLAALGGHKLAAVGYRHTHRVAAASEAVEAAGAFTPARLQLAIGIIPLNPVPAGMRHEQRVAGPSDREERLRHGKPATLATGQLLEYYAAAVDVPDGTAATVGCINRSVPSDSQAGQRGLLGQALGLGEGFAIEITNPSAIAEPDHQPPIGHREAARRVVKLDLAHQFPAWLEDGHSRIAGDINQAVGHGHVTRLAKSGRTPAIGFRFGGIGVGAGLHCHAYRGDGLGTTAEKLAPRRIRLTVAGRATAVGRGF